MIRLDVDSMLPLAKGTLMYAYPLLLFSATIAATLLISGCAPNDASPARSILDLSDVRVETGKRFETVPGMPLFRVVLAEPSVGLSSVGGQVELAEVLRANLSDALVARPNLRLLNRSASADAQAEWQLVARRAANPEQVPVTPGISFPHLLLKPTLSYVEREIRADGSRGEWNLLVAISGERSRVKGAVELLIEAIDVRTNETVTTVRAAGLLFDDTRSGGATIGYVGGATRTRLRVPEAQAIRAASLQAVEQLHQFLEQETQAWNPTSR